jgi:hypothetical protein
VGYSEVVLEPYRLADADLERFIVEALMINRQKRKE